MPNRKAARVFVKVEQVVEAVKTLGEPVTLADLCNLLNSNRGGTGAAVSKAVAAGRLIRHPKKGQRGAPTYTMPDPTQHTPAVMKRAAESGAPPHQINMLPVVTKINDVEYIQLSDALTMVEKAKNGLLPIMDTYKVLKVCEELNMSGKLLVIALDYNHKFPGEHGIKPGKRLSIRKP